MTSVQQVPGDIQIKTISLFTNKGVVNILEHVKNISIFESIFTPGIMVEITVWDTKNIASQLPILGGQRLLIQFCTPGRKDLKYDLIVTDIKDAGPSENMRSKIFMLLATSPEVLRNKSNLVMKSYNTNISSMVSDIITYYLGTKKQVDVQQTKGIQKIIIQNENPFNAISMIRKRSISVDDKSSAFVFFENQTGYHFKTIEKLMSGGTGDRVFTNDETIRTDITLPIFRNLINYEQPSQYNTVSRIGDGGLSVDVSKFDFKTLQYSRKSTKFDPSNFKNADGTLKDPDSDELKQYGRSSGKLLNVFHDSSNPDTFISENSGLKNNITTLFSQGGLLLHVFGDSELTAGQMIEVKVLENATSSGPAEEHHLLSGKYLIAFLRHEISSEGNNPRYTCSMEVVKGGYKEAANG
jgi:hypothetical protein